MTTAPEPERVTRADIEAKFRELQGGVDEAADQAVKRFLYRHRKSMSRGDAQCFSHRIFDFQRSARTEIL